MLVITIAIDLTKYRLYDIALKAVKGLLDLIYDCWIYKLLCLQMY